VYQELQRLPRHGELDALDGLGADLEGDVLGVVDQHPVPTVRQVERHVLVGHLRAGAAVGVPDVDRLPVLHERAEALAEPVDGLADAEVELGVHVPARRGETGGRHAREAGRLGRDRSTVRERQVPDRLAARAGEPRVAVPEREVPRLAPAELGT
jgi:hypothetical protein